MESGGLREMSFMSSEVDLAKAEKIKKCSCTVLKRALDPTPIFIPFTLRRVICWLIYGGVVAGMIYSNFWGHYFAFLQSDLFYIFIFLFVLFDFFPYLLGMLFGRFDDALPHRVCPEIHPSLAVIIVCHKSEDVIAKTLYAVLEVVPPENVFVAHNGNSQIPVDATETIVASIDPRINYTWLSVGNKSIAQWVTARHIQANCPHICNVMVLDDDVIVPDTFRLLDGKLGGNVKAVAYPIRGASSLRSGQRDCATRLLTDFQSIEYTMAMGWKGMENRIQHGLTKPHGAVSIWDVGTFITVMDLHNSVFYGEDRLAGEILSRLGHEMLFDSSIIFYTFTPQTCCGVLPNWFKQRAGCWDMARFSYFIPLTLRPCLTTCHTRIGALVLHKIGLLMEILLMVIDFLRFPTIVFSSQFWLFWVIIFGSLSLQVICLVIFNYGRLRHRPDLQSGVLPIILLPFLYRPLLWVASSLAILKSILVQIPGDRVRWSIQHMVDHGQLVPPVFGAWQSKKLKAFSADSSGTARGVDSSMVEDSSDTSNE
jgi:hypothetical protein